MPDTRPVAAAKPIVLTFRYDVDDAFIERWIDEHGEQPSRQWTIDIDLRELASPELRRTVRAAHAIYRASDWHLLLSEPTQSVEVIAAAIVNRDAAEREEQRRAAEVEAEAKQALADEQAIFTREMDAWIEAHGSEHLKESAARDYVVTRLYAIERVRSEFPGAWVDFGNVAEWKPRANPSSDALALEQGVEHRIADSDVNDAGLSNRIVWLTHYPRDMERFAEVLGIESEAMEAISIKPWLGRYHLLVPVDPAACAPIDGEVA